MQKLGLNLICLIFSMCLLPVGCGKVSRDAGEFEPLLKKFENYYQQYNGVKMVVGNILIRRDNLTPNQLAVCRLSNEGPAILINNAYWDKLSDETKEVVFIHESGHCFVGRLHNNNAGVDRKWESIMEQRPQELTDYSANKDAYLKELFNSKTTTPDQ